MKLLLSPRGVALQLVHYRSGLHLFFIGQGSTLMNHVSLHHWSKRRIASYNLTASASLLPFRKTDLAFEISDTLSVVLDIPTMPLCVSCDRLFSSEQALQQHRQDSPIHKTTLYCKPCNRFFRSKEALKQHHDYASVHTGKDCKACNRTFKSNDALKQHQNDSPVHQKQSPENVTPETRPVFSLDTYPSSYKAQLEVRERNNPQTTQTLSRNNTDLKPRRHQPPRIPKTPSRVLDMPVRDSTIKPSHVPTAKVSKPKEEGKTLFRFPELHEKVAEAVLPEVTSTWFQSNASKEYVNEYVTCVVGTFTCNNQACKKQSWVSGVVSILIRGYCRNGYSAVVYNQRCKSCCRLGILAIDETTYVERIAYRIKKWAGFRVESRGYIRESKGPHEEMLCEGCKRGTCPYIAKPESRITD